MFLEMKKVRQNLQAREQCHPDKDQAKGTCFLRLVSDSSSGSGGWMFEKHFGHTFCMFSNG